MKWKLRVEGPQEPQLGTITIEAKTKKEALEKAEELFENDPDAFEWDYQDICSMDYLEVLSVRKIDEGA